MQLKPLCAVALVLLCEKPMHPYEMFQTLRTRGDDRLVKVRPGSLYRSVERLVEDGLATVVRVEQKDNRPERTVYGILPAGREAAREWVRENLAEEPDEFLLFPLVLSLAPILEWPEARRMLERRLDALRAQHEDYRSSVEAARAKGVPVSHLLEDEFQRSRLAHEIDFVEQLVRRVDDGRLEWVPNRGAAAHGDAVPA